MPLPRVRGIRDITTIHTVHGRRSTSPHAQIATELARLEHERARLERTLEAWESNRRQTAERLAAIQLQASKLQQALETQPTVAATELPEQPTWRAVRLEY